MRTTFDNLVRVIKNISLTSAERSHARTLLVHAMQEHPFSSRGIVAMLSRFMHRRSQLTSVLACAVIIVGFSMLAQSAVPGNVTYPLKVTIERLGDVVIISEDGQLQWDIIKAERRIQEAEQLAIEQEL